MPSSSVENPKLNLTALSFSFGVNCIVSRTGLPLCEDEHALPVEMKNPFSLNARSMTCPGIPGNAA